MASIDVAKVMLLASSGMSIQEIADELKVHRSTMYKFINDNGIKIKRTYKRVVPLVKEEEKKEPLIKPEGAPEERPTLDKYLELKTEFIFCEVHQRGVFINLKKEHTAEEISELLEKVARLIRGGF